MFGKTATFAIGDRVLVKVGALQGFEGVVERLGGRLGVRVTIGEKVVLAEIPKRYLERL